VLAITKNVAVAKAPVDVIAQLDDDMRPVGEEVNELHAPTSSAENAGVLVTVTVAPAT
jgi:hypothetical protein